MEGNLKRFVRGTADFKSLITPISSPCEVDGLPLEQHEWVDLDEIGFVVQCSGVK
jgi:hypothetical protein